MGFLSRKNKSKPVAVEEPHPIVEELQRMEEVVPEREERWDDEVTDEARWDDEGSDHSPTGPVAEEDPSSSQATDASSTPALRYPKAFPCISSTAPRRRLARPRPSTT